MLNLFGVEMLFIFKLATIFSLARITIRVTKFVKGTTTYKTENLEPFIEKMFKIMICIAASMMCVRFTVFASWTIKFVFIGFFSIFIALSIFFKKSHFKVMILLVGAFAYGIVLAKWYQLNPIEGNFGNNSFLESIGIILSSVILIFPVSIISEN